MTIDEAWDKVGIAIQEKNDERYYTALNEVKNSVAEKTIALFKIAVILSEIRDPCLFQCNVDALDKIKAVIKEIQLPAIK